MTNTQKIWLSWFLVLIGIFSVPAYVFFVLGNPTHSELDEDVRLAAYAVCLFVGTGCGWGAGRLLKQVEDAQHRNQ